MKVRVITINLAGTKDDWLEKRMRLIIEGLAALKPDVVCLQETTLSRGRQIIDQASMIGEAIALRSVAFAPYGNLIEVMSHDQGGIAILSRWPIRRVRNRRLPGAHEHPPDSRVALFVVLDSPAGELQVVTTHLSWEPDAAPLRLIQMGLILDDLFQSQPPAPDLKLVFAGDLNAIETEPAIQLSRESLVDLYRAKNPGENGFTWLTSNPLTRHFPTVDRRLDYVFCPRGAKILKAEVVLGETNEGYPSDHLGVLAEIEWPSNPAA